ncbi:uncharacterized protein SCHCODRAFT_02705888 [Schizophyllum commune H4-8]|uniref:uncharacterized protein n=1 Tax=Schizophyllum commune (strain H4-8 / FGSC 9210) TaxID=578458 RepID=UPI00215EFA8B|nr:uncharacterized protein SCHCODRAFT_02705888 [Schizophyllum commune H4-8]KAI5886273.1 hypothetical protein SCHCODRAFT_02705888 [Schizophyllum commune H4-8]
MSSLPRRFVDVARDNKGTSPSSTHTSIKDEFSAEAMDLRPWSSEQDFGDDMTLLRETRVGFPSRDLELEVPSAEIRYRPDTTLASSTNLPRALTIYEQRPLATPKPRNSRRSNEALPDEQVDSDASRGSKGASHAFAFPLERSPSAPPGFLSSTSSIALPAPCLTLLPGLEFSCAFLALLDASFALLNASSALADASL